MDSGVLAHHRTKPLILYAEDDPIAREQIARVLSLRGYDAIIAEDGSKAAELFENHHPDILLTDIIMPGMNGLELARHVKAANPETCVILLTAFNETENFMQAIDIGINHFIVKPVVLQKLIATLDAGIAHLRVLREKERMEEERQRIHQLEAIGVLAGGIAHDFNNLFQVVRGYMMLAMMKTDPASDIHEYLALADTAIVQAHELSSELLAFSRGGPSRKALSDIAPVIGRTLEESEIPANIRLTSRIPGDLPHIFMDSRQIAAALKNIIQNSVEAMPGGGSLAIEARCVTDYASAFEEGSSAEYLEISVSDSGCGIPEEILPRIYEPYFSTKGLSANKGTGLGLAIANAFVMNHSGKIWSDSEVGKGSVFRILLPIKAADGGNEPASSA